ncbi:hypothetical protein XENOCAPTIV_006122, partial [Xenoophorus captivus]
VHLDELDIAEDLIHLLHSSIRDSHTFPPEVGSHSGAEHLKPTGTHHGGVKEDEDRRSQQRCWTQYVQVVCYTEYS